MAKQDHKNKFTGSQPLQGQEGLDPIQTSGPTPTLSRLEQMDIHPVQSPIG